MNHPAYFEIQADSCDRAIRFYREVFGWRFEKVEGLPVEYWKIETDGPRGGLLKRPVPVPNTPSGTNAYVCSMEVKDFDQVAAKILQVGGRVAMAKFAVPGTCWQGYFLDTESNTFGIFQVDTLL